MHNTLQTLVYLGEKHHGGWGLLNVKRGVGLFTNITQSYESYERKIRKILVSYDSYESYERKIRKIH